MLRALLFLLLAQSLWGQTPSLQAELNSSFVVEGEVALVTITVRNINVTGWPTQPNVSPLTLRQERYSRHIVNRDVSVKFNYAVSSIKSGTFTIPPFRIGQVVSNPLTLTVASRDQLKKNSISIGGQSYPYYSTIFINNLTPYLGETQTIEARLYLSDRLQLVNERYAEIEKNEAVMWRFDPVKSNGGLQENGQSFSAVTYRSAVTPLKTGPVKIGPGKVEPLVTRSSSGRGNISWERYQIKCLFDEILLNVKELPSPPPPGFAGAIGNFRLSASVAGREIEVGDPLTVELQITGSGNLDQLGPPRFLDEASHFKQFDITKKPQGTDRRTLSGTVEFSQVIRPNQVTDRLPPYELVYFDPILSQYSSSLTPEIPLTVAASKTPSPVTASPTEKGSKNAPLTSGSYVIPAVAVSQPLWFWQIFPALLSLYLLIKALRPKFAKKQKQSLSQREFARELNEVTSSKDRTEVFRRASRFLDRWGDKKPLPEGASEIIKTRDEICFSPDSKAELILPKEKSSLVAVLRQLAPLVLLALILSPSLLNASETRGELIEQITANPTPEAFYNLALEEEGLGNTAAAIFYYYRYQAYGDKSEPLTPLLRSTGSIRLAEPRGMEMIALLPRSLFHHCGIAFLWGLGMSLFVLVMRVRRWAFFLIPITVITGTFWLLAEFYYPQDISFEPLKELSIVTTEQALRDAPFEGAGTGRIIPLGSIGKIEGTSGDWSFIELPGGSKGWVSRREVAPIAGRELLDPPTSQTN